MRAIVTFHSIDENDSVLSYPPTLFRKFVEALLASDLPVCDLDTLLRNDNQHGVALTFDDGMHSIFEHALPVIRAHAMPAHLFLATAAVGRDNRWPGQPAQAPRLDMLNWNQVEALHAAGVRIESHTHNHPDLRALDDAAIDTECDMADRLIEQRLGRRPAYFAYPYGYHNARVRDCLRPRYRASVTTRLNVLNVRDDSADLPRLDSYYLRAPWLYRRLDAPVARAYLACRGVLRRLRGSE